jgi:uncharacterized protein (TIGR04255 family)
MVFKLDFSTEINVENNFDEFFDALDHVFKYYETKTKPKSSIKIRGDEGEIKTVETPFSWIFHDKKRIEDSTLRLELKKNYIILDFIAERSEDKSFNYFKKYIELICKALPTYNVKQARYVGLRYINKIIREKGNPFQWKNLINPDLLSTNLLNKYENKTRFMNEFEFKKDDFDIIFKFGLFNSEYPNPIARKEFVLDYDCNTDEPQSLLDINDISEKMNLVIYYLFEESIEKELRDIME